MASANRGNKRKKELSEIRTIKTLFEELGPELRVNAEQLYEQLKAEWPTFFQARETVARLLFEFQGLFAKPGRDGDFQFCLKQIGIPHSTAYDLIDFHKQLTAQPATVLKAAREARLDLTRPRVLKKVAKAVNRQDLSLDEARGIVAAVAAQPSRKSRKPSSIRDVDPVRAATELVRQALIAALAEVPTTMKEDAFMSGVEYCLVSELGDTPGNQRVLTAKAATDFLLSAGTRVTASESTISSSVN